MQSLVGPKKWLTDSLLGYLLLCIITVSFDLTSEHKVKLILFHLRLENPPTMNPIIVGAPFWCESDRWNKTNMIEEQNNLPLISTKEGGHDRPVPEAILLHFYAVTRFTNSNTKTCYLHAKIRSQSLYHPITSYQIRITKLIRSLISIHLRRNKPREEEPAMIVSRDRDRIRWLGQFRSATFHGLITRYLLGPALRTAERLLTSANFNPEP